MNTHNGFFSVYRRMRTAAESLPRRVMTVWGAGIFLMTLMQWSSGMFQCGDFFSGGPGGSAVSCMWISSVAAQGLDDEDDDGLGGDDLSEDGDGDENPFADAGDTGDEEDEEIKAPAGGGGGKTAPAAKEDSLYDEFGRLFAPGERQFGDAGVEAVLGTNPKTAAELVQAGKIIADLGRLEIAKTLFKRAVAVKPTDAEMYDMVMTHGQSFFATLAKGKKYGPEGQALGQMVLSAMNRRFQDESILKTTVKQLGHADARLRRQALTDLQARSGIAVPLLLTSLVDPEMKGQREEIEQALLSFGGMTTDAVRAVLDSDNYALKTACVKLLAMQATQNNAAAIQNLFLAAAEREPAAEPLRKAAYDALSGILRRPFPEDGSSEKFIAEFILIDLNRYTAELNLIRSREKTDTSVTVVWRWNPETKKPESAAKSTEDALTLNCFRFAKALWKMCPDSALAKREFLKNTLEQTLRAEGVRSETLLKTPVFKMIREEFSLVDVEALLTTALQEKSFVAATGAAVLLGEMGDASLLVPREYRDGAGAAAGLFPLAPIITAINSPSRSVRFAAMETVMKWNPQKPYAGSQLLIDNLAWFLSTTGKSKVLVTGRDAADSSLLGGRFLPFGYYYDTAESGREAVLKCQASSDYAFLLVSMETQNPSPAFLTQSLRQDVKLADIPVVFVARSEHFRAAENLAQRIPRTLWFPRPTNAADVGMLMTLLERMQGFSPITDLQRLEETRKCLVWAEKIVSTHRGAWVRRLAGEESDSPVLEVYDITKLQMPVMHLMSISAYTAEVSRVLAWLGTQRSQQTLLMFASAGTHDLDLRKECVRALELSVNHFGILLNGSEVARQYDIYNDTPESDKDSKIVRDAILTVLESPLMKKNDPQNNEKE